MQQFSNQEIAGIRSVVDQIHDMLANRGGDAPVIMNEIGQIRDTRPGAMADARPVLVDQLSFSIQLRRIRRSHFGGVRLSGATWDMMLDLMLADTHGRQLSASDLATGAGVPLSSGLRMIATLEEHGLAKRSIDERDRRRSLVRLTERGVERMTAYFERVGELWQSSI